MTLRRRGSRSRRFLAIATAVGAPGMCTTGFGEEEPRLISRAAWRTAAANGASSTPRGDDAELGPINRPRGRRVEGVYERVKAREGRPADRGDRIGDYSRETQVQRPCTTARGGRGARSSGVLGREGGGELGPTVTCSASRRNMIWCAALASRRQSR